MNKKNVLPSYQSFRSHHERSLGFRLKCHEVVNAKIRLIGVFGHTVCFGRLRGSETGKQVYPEVSVLDHRLNRPPPRMAPPHSTQRSPFHVGGHKKGQPLMCGSTCWAPFSSQSCLRDHVISAEGAADGPVRRHELSL